MRILLWHVHGSWTTSLVQGSHEYLLPVDTERTADGLGRARTWTWPDSAVEVSPDSLADEDVDAVILQRPHELGLAARWLRRRPGVDVPAVYVEHNTPGNSAATSVHPLADRTDIPLVHVTHFNALMWDSGRAPTTVIEHGIVDPGYRYEGGEGRVAAVVNEPGRRGRAVGADLLRPLAGRVPLDVYGMGVDTAGAAYPVGAELRVVGDLPQDQLHEALARHRVYAHLHRWTSLGLSLLEAMHVGLPVVVAATAEAAAVLPREAGCVSCCIDDLAQAARTFLDEPDRAREAGQVAREFALSRYGLARFLREWDELLADVVRERSHSGNAS